MACHPVPISCPVFGWLFWQRSLEAAMLSHASVHVVLITVSIAYLLAA